MKKLLHTTKKIHIWILLTYSMCLLSALFTGCAAKKSINEVPDYRVSKELEKWAEEEWAKEECVEGENGHVAGNGKIADPLEPVNRFFFTFNDKMYFWVLKPIARTYANILPEDIRGCLKNAVVNLLMPVRFTNNILQGKFKNSGIELSRFLINSTMGVYGLGDPAKTEFGLEEKEEDLGQTLGHYGLGDGFYICWPIFGPSNIRDTFGRAGDGFMNPLSYMLPYDEGYGLSSQVGIRINETSLTLGTYEQFKESSFDPYIAVRDAYKQHRDSKIKDTTKLKGSVTYTEEGVCLPLE